MKIHVHNWEWRALVVDYDVRVHSFRYKYCTSCGKVLL